MPIALHSLSNTPQNDASVGQNISCLTGPFCSPKRDVSNSKTDLLGELMFKRSNSNTLFLNAMFLGLYLSELVEQWIKLKLEQEHLFAIHI